MAGAVNYLTQLMQNPGSYTGSPGYQFALDQGTQAAQRRGAVTGGGGNALAALAKYSSGLATQDYGNAVQRALGAAQLEQQGTQADQRLALDRQLGEGNLALGNKNSDQSYTLGQGQLGLGNKTADQNFGLGMYRANNDFTLGQGQNANTAQRNLWDYTLGGQQNANTAAANANTFATNQGRLGLDAYGAQTDRARAQSADWLGRDSAARAWMPFASRQGVTGYEDRRPSWARY